MTNLAPMHILIKFPSIRNKSSTQEKEEAHILTLDVSFLCVAC